MKKFVLSLIAVAFVTLGYSQSNKEDVDMIQALYGKDKKDLMAGFIKLDGTQKDQFWKLYDEYETERKKLGRERIALLEKYANNYSTAGDKQIDSIMKTMFTLGIKTDKLIETYYNKMKTKAGYQAAAQFSQLESYLLSIVRATLLEKIPFFGELYN